MHRQSAREKARAFRTAGKSISEIAHSLRISTSTVSYWCRDILLSKRQQLVLTAKQQRSGAMGRLVAADKKRVERLHRTAMSMHEGAQDVGVLKTRDLYMLGLALYWGEGYKSGNEECGLTNSDPHLIRVFIRWLQQVYQISAGDLILRVSLNGTHAHRVRAVEKYWANVTGIPLKQFTAPSLIKTISKKVYANQESHFGTLRVKVRRGTSLRRRIIGSLGEVRRQMEKLG